MRIQCDQVRAVQLADGWHTVEHGTFRIEAVQFEAVRFDAALPGGYGWPEAFTFETPDG